MNQRAVCSPETERKDFSRKLTYSYSFDQLPLKGWGALAWLGLMESHYSRAPAGTLPSW